MGVEVTSRTLLPERVDLLLHGAGRAGPDRDQDDHRPDADRQPEHREPRAQLVGGQAGEGDADRLVHGAGSANGVELIGDDLAIAEHDDPVGVLGHLALVRDQHDRRALVAEPLEDGQDLAGRAGVEVAGRLVGQDHRRVGHQRSGDRHPLLLSARQLGGEMVDPVGQAHLGQRGQRPLPALVAAQPGVGQRQLDVAERSRARDQIEALEDEADLAVAQIRQVVLVGAADVESVEAVDAAARRIQAAEDVHQRGLAAARAAHDRHVLARLQP